MIVKISFLVVASVAALAMSCSRKRKTVNKAMSSADVTSMLQTQIEAEKELEFTDSKFKVIKTNEEQEESNGKLEMHTNKFFNDFKNETGAKEIQSLEKEFEQRKLTLEGKLLILYGLRECQLHITRLRRYLEAKEAEIDILNATITSLRTESRELHEEIIQNQLAGEQLEIDNEKIREMEAKMQGSANEKIKGELMKIEERVCGMQVEGVCSGENIAEEKHNKVEDVKMELVEMRRRNKELQLEKRELNMKLESVLARLGALSNNNVTESKIPANVENDLRSLRNTNKELVIQIERLQKKRFNMVEELVYQRWLNACLKFEINSCHNPSRNNNSIPCLDSFSSSPTSSVESKEFNSTNFDSSFGSQTSSKKKLSLIRKIKSWGRRNQKNEHVSLSRRSILRRFSTSMIRNEKGGQEATQSPNILSFTRRRRVSFNDSVETYSFASQEEEDSTVGLCLEDKEMDIEDERRDLEQKQEESTAAEVQITPTETNKLQPELPIVVVVKSENKTKMSSFGTVLFIFFFILLLLCVTFCI